MKHFLQALALVATTVGFLGISLPSYSYGDGGGGKPAPWVGKSFWGDPCEGSRIPFGPYDYTQRAKYPAQLFITEEYHFTKRIANLQQDTTTSAIKDIQYTLMAWPNHHGALHSAFNYRKIHRGEWRQGANTASPVECHLQRAISFSPNDPVPYMLYGMLLYEFELYEDALQAYRKANQLMPNDIITLYNLGLTMTVLEKYKQASEVAVEVYSTDFPLPGLQNKLIAAGYWEAGVGPVEPPPAEEETAETPMDESLAEESPSAETSTGESPAEESQSAEAPTGESLPEESLSAEAPTGESLPEESLSAESPPAESLSGESLPDEEPQENTGEKLAPAEPPVTEESVSLID